MWNSAALHASHASDASFTALAAHWFHKHFRDLLVPAKESGASFVAHVLGGHAEWGYCDVYFD